MLKERGGEEDVEKCWKRQQRAPLRGWMDMSLMKCIDG